MNDLVNKEVIDELHELIKNPTRVENCLKYFHEQLLVSEKLYDEYLVELKRLDGQYKGLEHAEMKRTVEYHQMLKHTAMQPLMTLHLHLHQTYWKSIRIEHISESAENRFRFIYGELTKDFKNGYEYYKKTPQ